MSTAAATTTNVGINGFGRIGRHAFRQSLRMSEIRVVAINDPFLDAEGAANAIRLDSAAGRFQGTVEVKGKNLIVVDGRRVAFTTVSDPAQIPWSEQNVAYVLECSGVYTTAERASSHLAGGAQRVVIGTVSADAPTLILGANEESFKGSMQVMAAGSSVAVALCPALRALHNAFGVDSCVYTCLHTASGAKATDSTNHKDPRGARAAIGNIVPITNNAADLRTVARVLPRLGQRVVGSAVRVPTVAGGCLLDLTVTLAESASLGRVVAALEDVTCAVSAVAANNSTTSPAYATVGDDSASGTPTKSTQAGVDASPAPSAPSAASPAPAGRRKVAPLAIIGATRDPVVSSDFAGETRSAVLDITASYAIPSGFAGGDASMSLTSPLSATTGSVAGGADDRTEGRQFKLVLWFDNERAFAQRMLDLVAYTCQSW